MIANVLVGQSGPSWFRLLLILSDNAIVRVRQVPYAADRSDALVGVNGQRS